MPSYILWHVLFSIVCVMMSVTQGEDIVTPDRIEWHEWEDVPKGPPKEIQLLAGYMLSVDAQVNRQKNSGIRFKILDPGDPENIYLLTSINIPTNGNGNLTVALSKCWTYGYQTTFNFRDFDRSANSMIWTFQMTEDAYKVYCQDKLIKEIKLSEVGNKCPSTVTSTSQTLTSTKTLQIIFMSIDDASGEIRYPKEVLPEGQGTKKDNTDYRTADEVPPTEAGDRYQVQKIIDNEPPELETNSDGIKVWNKKIEEPIPYKVINDIARSPDPLRSPLGYLAFSGYMDFSLDVRTGTTEVDGKKDHLKATQADVDKATQSFLQFNGFVENGEVTDEMVEFMKRQRCGNPDLVYSNERAKHCHEMTESKILESSSKHKQNIIADARSFVIPGENSDLLSEDISYYCEVDIKYPPLKNGRTKRMFMVFNYEEEAGEKKAIEMISVRFRNMELCVQFISKKKASYAESCYIPTKNEKTTRHFKVRLNVYKTLGNSPGTILVTIRGKDIMQSVYLTPIVSSVMVILKNDFTGKISLARLCKQKHILDDNANYEHSRNKRALSYYKWNNPSNEIRFQFQNYSSHLGKENTRVEVIEALKLYSSQTKLTFKEVRFDSRSDIVFMFIKGQHADGKHFQGATTEKAHAYYPVHGEIHFNDNQHFSKTKGAGTTSMFWTAAHEIGHAMGIAHSSVKKALMAEGYPENAYEFSSFHIDDQQSLNAHYQVQVDGDGGVTVLPDVKEPDEKYMYNPKFPIPKGCHTKIDAALTVGENPTIYYLISGPFLWKILEKDDGFDVYHGYPRRVTNIFESAFGMVHAMFSVKIGQSERIFIIHDDNKVSHYQFTQFGDDNTKTTMTHKSTSDMFRGVDKRIKAAFQHDAKIILIAHDLQSYYEVTWKTLWKKPHNIVEKNNVIDIIGRGLEHTDFNAAMTKNGKLYVFRKKYVFIEEKFQEENEQPGRKEIIQDFFSITGWCNK